MDFKKFLTDAGVDPQYHEQMLSDLKEVKAVAGVFLPNGNRDINEAFKNLWHESGLTYRVVPGQGMLIASTKRNPPKSETVSEVEALKAKIAKLEAAISGLPAGKPLDEVLKGDGGKITAPPDKPPVQVQRRSGRSSAPPPSDI